MSTGRRPHLFVGSADGLRAPGPRLQQVPDRRASCVDSSRRPPAARRTGASRDRRTASDESHILKLKRNRTALRKRGNMFTPEQLQADEPGFRWVIENNTLFDPTPHRERLIEAFRPENRAFAAATGYDLAKMKYPV